MSETYVIRIAGGVTPEVTSSIDRLRAGVNGASSALSGLAGKLAGVFGTFRLLQFGKDAINAADELGKFSQEVGVSVEQLSKWKYSADLADVGEQFRTGMLKFSGALADSTERGSRASLVFQAMGIKTVDAAGKVRATGDVFLEVADKISTYTDSANKTALVQDLFGTKNARFITMLNQGSAGLRAQADELERMGGVFTSADAANAEAFNDSLTKVKAGLSGLAISVASQVVPNLTVLIETFNNAAASGGKMSPVFQVLTGGFRALSIGIVEAYGFLELFGIALGQLPVAAWEAMKGNFSNAKAVWQQMNRDLEESQQRRYDRIDQLKMPIPKLVEATVRQAGGKVDAPNVGAVKTARNDELEFMRNAYRIEADRVALAREKLKASFELTSWEKRDLELVMLDQEADYLTKQIALLKEKRDLTSDDAARAAYDREINSFEDKRRGVFAQRAGMSGEADPRSIREQLTASITQLRESFGTVATNIAQGFRDVIGGAVQSVSNGITGLIMRTKTWRQALLEVGTSILTSLVSAVVQLGVRWIATQILMAVAGKSIQAAATAATAPIAAAQAAIWAAPATLATIASYGTAAALAPGFIAGAQAGVMAQSLGGMAAGFASGGYTGDGATGAFAGFVHGQEYVLNAPATAEYRPILDAMNRRELRLSDGSGQRSGGGDRTPVNVAWINDRQDEREFQARDGWKITADKLRQRGVRIG